MIAIHINGAQAHVSGSSSTLATGGDSETGFDGWTLTETPVDYPAEALDHFRLLAEAHDDIEIVED